MFPREGGGNAIGKLSLSVLSGFLRDLFLVSLSTVFLLQKLGMQDDLKNVEYHLRIYTTLLQGQSHLLC